MAAAATGALRRVLLPMIRRRLATSTGQPLISFTGARAGTTEVRHVRLRFLIFIISCRTETVHSRI